MGIEATILVVVLIVWIFSLCLHEFSHAAVAYLGGDETVKEKGYLSFNPLAYTHPVLSIVLPVVFLLMGGLALPGGAVYIDRSLLRSRTWDFMVSAAGPASNLLLGLILALPVALGLVELDPGAPLTAAYALIVAIQFLAALFNLIPIPPLDGYHMIAAWLPDDLRAKLDNLGGFTFLAFLVIWISVPGVQLAIMMPVAIAVTVLGIDWDYVVDGFNALTFLTRGG